MKKPYFALSGAFLLTLLSVSPTAYSATPDKDPELTSIQTEIDRNMKGLRIDKMPTPCYIDFRLTDLSTLNIKANRGALIGSDENRYRIGMPTVLVGDYTTTNENFIPTFRELYNHRNSSIGVVLSSDDVVIRTAIWKVLDDRYKTAAELYSNKINQISQIELPEEERNIPDFERRESSQYISLPQPLVYNRKTIEEYVTTASNIFKEYKELDDSHIQLYAGGGDVRYSNSEGTVCRYPNNLIIINIYTRSQSKDGQEIAQNKQLAFDSFDKLPSLVTLQSICREQVELMKKKLSASMIKESYVGPVLFEGEAVADLATMLMVSDNGILAKRKPISTNELRRNYSGNSVLNANELESMFNKKVISRDLTVTSLTGTPEYKGEKLFGHYKVDAQGVKPANELVLIEEGVLRNMLTTRTPTLLFRNSNGHARTSINGGNVVLRPGVLRISTKTATSADDMKKKLIDAAKEEDYDYAYIVRKIDGGVPSELIRLNVKDGSEELIRGAAIKELSLRALKRISAISGKENIYNRIHADIKSTYIVPSAILLEEVDVVKDNKLVLKKSYVAEKP